MDDHDQRAKKSQTFFDYGQDMKLEGTSDIRYQRIADTGQYLGYSVAILTMSQEACDFPVSEVAVLTGIANAAMGTGFYSMYYVHMSASIL